MNNLLSTSTIGILIPFVGTTVGAALVFLLKNKMSDFIHKSLLGFSSGVMIAASIWSLIMPAIEMTENQQKIAWIPASVGFMLGIITLMLIDKVISKMEKLKEKNDKCKCSKKYKEKSTTMLALAVTLHNIPEGMAVGVTFAGLLAGNVGITVAGAMALAIGIGIQNIPEGAIISMPLKSSGMPKIRAFTYGTASGIVEPIGAAITILLTNLVVPILPYLLAFAAGAMIYVAAVELIPEMEKGKYAKVGTISLGIGFSIMMILDVALG